MYLFGASGHGKVIKEILEAGGGKVEAHECLVGDYCFITLHATLHGQVHVGEGTPIGVGA